MRNQSQWMQDMHRPQLVADAAALVSHNSRMERGCLVCKSAVVGRVCPDCYTCVACGEGCDECASARAP